MGQATALLGNSAIRLIEPENEDRQETPQVLIVDDEPMNVYVIQSLLK